jgi:hypothetical protein
MKLFGLLASAAAPIAVRIAAPIAECKAWRRTVSAAVGGLREIGFSEDESALLVVSHDGRGLFDTVTGERLARDDDRPETNSDWFDAAHRRVRGIGKTADRWVGMVGLWGGALALDDRQGWRAELVGKGRHEQALVGLQGEQQRWRVAAPIAEVRAFGFSASGRFLVLATSADLTVFAKAEAG